MPRHIGSPLVVQPWKMFLAVQAVASGLSNSICSFFPWTTSKGDFASYPQGCLPSHPFNPSFKRLDRSIKPSAVSLVIYTVPYRPRRTSRNPREGFSQVAATNHGCSWCPCQTFGFSCWVSTLFLSAIHVSFFLLLLVVSFSI